MSKEEIRVLLADDHPLVREGVRHVLESGPGFRVVGEAADGTTAVRLALDQAPDVVVLDISMPGASGLAVAAELREKQPAAKVLILSVHDHAEYVLESVRAGAHGYLRKDAAPAELRSAIRAVHEGEAYFSAPVARQLSQALRAETERAQRSSKWDLLTSRERDVLLGVAQGATNKQIAARLGISPRTVETHRESLMRKLEIRTVAGLTRFVVDAGTLPA